MRKGLELLTYKDLEFIAGFPTGNIRVLVTKEELIELENELKRLNDLEMECNRLSAENQFLEEEHKALEFIREYPHLENIIEWAETRDYCSDTNYKDLLKEVLL